MGRRLGYYVEAYTYTEALPKARRSTCVAALKTQYVDVKEC